jgi:hypothetical protein
MPASKLLILLMLGSAFRETWRANCLRAGNFVRAARINNGPCPRLFISNTLSPLSVLDFMKKVDREGAAGGLLLHTCMYEKEWNAIFGVTIKMA